MLPVNQALRILFRRSCRSNILEQHLWARAHELVSIIGEESEDCQHTDWLDCTDWLRCSCDVFIRPGPCVLQHPGSSICSSYSAVSAASVVDNVLKNGWDLMETAVCSCQCCYCCVSDAHFSFVWRDNYFWCIGALGLYIASWFMGQ